MDVARDVGRIECWDPVSMRKWIVAVSGGVWMLAGIVKTQDTIPRATRFLCLARCGIGKEECTSSLLRQT